MGTNVAQIPKPRTSVPGQYLGYALQPVRLCFHLFDAPADARVSIEHLDDVAVHYSDGRACLEQNKSALSGNPASDRSVELWKTMANWADLCKAEVVSPSATDFRYYVTPAAHGALVERLHGANDEVATRALLAEISSSKVKGRPGSMAYPHIERFLAAGGDICCGIIMSFELVVENDPLESIRAKLQALLPPNVLDDFVEAAIGMAKAMAEHLIREGKAPLLSASEFRSRFRAFVLKHNLAGLLESTTGAPTEDEIANIIGGAPLFVRQLRAVDVSSPLLVTAVSDWLRTTADKIAWAAAGSIVESSLDELDSSLERHHILVADEVAEIHPAESPQARGRVVYRRCSSLQMPLEGRALPTHFISGAFNCLADAARLGWHPDYKTLFVEA